MTIPTHITGMNNVSLSLFVTASRDVLTWWEKIEEEKKMKKMLGCNCCSVKVLAVLTAALVVVFVSVLVLSFYGIPRIVNIQVDKSVELKENTDQWERFLNLPIPIITSIYLFNVTNAEEIIKGEIPKLIEVGPYVFNQNLSKKILYTSENDDSVTYEKYTEATFDQDLSGDLLLTDEVIILNPVFLVLTQITSPIEQLVVVGCLDKIFPAQYKDLFMKADIKTLMFDGFQFAAEDAGYACNVVRNQVIEKTKKMKNIQRIYNSQYPDVVDALKFSLLGFKTEGPDGVYTVNRGIDDVSQLGHVMQWNHSTNLPFWGRTESTNNETCQLVSGGDSTIYPPHVTKEQSFKIFATDICRSIEIVYSGEGSYKGITGMRFEPKEDTFRPKTSNAENDCFCTKRTADPQGNPSCFLDGVLDVYDCFGAPLLLSFPHFLYANESYLEGLEGIDPPDLAKHGIYLLIEPNTGTPLQGKKRVQLNLVLRSAKFVPVTTNVRPTVFPLLWLEEGAELSQDLADMLNNKFFNVVKIANGVKYGLIAVSAAALLIASGILVRKEILKW